MYHVDEQIELYQRKHKCRGNEGHNSPAAATKREQYFWDTFIIMCPTLSDAGGGEGLRR